MMLLLTLRRTGHKLASLLLLTALVAMSSCAEFDLGEDVEYVAPISVNIGDHYNLIVGDSTIITPKLSPDSVSLPTIYWHAEDPAIAIVRNGKVKGVGIGQTRVFATTVDGQISDTCTISVGERTEVEQYERGPYDMVIYASILNGEDKDVSTDYLVTAWCGDEVRGVGRVMHHQEKQYMVIRIYSQQPSGDIIRLRVRGRRNAVDYTSPEIIFDGETHGSLSNLYTIRVSD